MLMSDIRGQSETVGTILLVGLVITAVTLAGGVMLFGYLNQASVNEPLVNLEIEPEDGDDIRIQHSGGENIDTETTKVMANSSTLGSLTDADSFDGDQDGRFVTGESVTYTPSISEDTIDVLIIDRSTNTVIERETITLEDIFDFTSGDDVIDEVNDLQDLTDGRCGDEENVCEEDLDRNEEDIDGFGYVESTDDADVDLDGVDVEGALVVNVGGEVGGVNIQTGLIKGDVYIKAHGEDADVDVDLDDGTIERDLKIDTAGDVDVDIEDGTVEGNIDESADLDLSEP